MQILCSLCGEEIESEEFVLNQTTKMPEGNTLVTYNHIGCAEAFSDDIMDEMEGGAEGA